jgi:hypothetical protein
LRTETDNNATWGLQGTRQEKDPAAIKAALNDLGKTLGTATGTPLSAEQKQFIQTLLPNLQGNQVSILKNDNGQIQISINTPGLKATFTRSPGKDSFALQTFEQKDTPAAQSAQPELNAMPPNMETLHQLGQSLKHVDRDSIQRQGDTMTWTETYKEKGKVAKINYVARTGEDGKIEVTRELVKLSGSDHVTTETHSNGKLSALTTFNEVGQKETRGIDGELKSFDAKDGGITRKDILPQGGRAQASSEKPTDLVAGKGEYKVETGNVRRTYRMIGGNVTLTTMESRTGNVLGQRDNNGIWRMTAEGLKMGLGGPALTLNSGQGTQQAKAAEAKLQQLDMTQPPDVLKSQVQEIVKGLDVAQVRLHGNTGRESETFQMIFTADKGGELKSPTIVTNDLTAARKLFGTDAMAPHVNGLAKEAANRGAMPGGTYTFIESEGKLTVKYDVGFQQKGEHFIGSLVSVADPGAKTPNATRIASASVANSSDSEVQIGAGVSFSKAADWVATVKGTDNQKEAAIKTLLGNESQKSGLLSVSSTLADKRVLSAVALADAKTEKPVLALQDIKSGAAVTYKPLDGATLGQAKTELNKLAVAPTSVNDVRSQLASVLTRANAKAGILSAVVRFDGTSFTGTHATDARMSADNGSGGDKFTGVTIAAHDVATGSSVTALEGTLTGANHGAQPIHGLENAVALLGTLKTKNFDEAKQTLKSQLSTLAAKGVISAQVADFKAQKIFGASILSNQTIERDGNTVVVTQTQAISGKASVETKQTMVEDPATNTVTQTVVRIFTDDAGKHVVPGQKATMGGIQYDVTQKDGKMIVTLDSKSLAGKEGQQLKILESNGDILSGALQKAADFTDKEPTYNLAFSEPVKMFAQNNSSLEQTGVRIEPGEIKAMMSLSNDGGKTQIALTVSKDGSVKFNDPAINSIQFNGQTIKVTPTADGSQSLTVSGDQNKADKSTPIVYSFNNNGLVKETFIDVNSPRVAARYASDITSAKVVGERYVEQGGKVLGVDLHVVSDNGTVYKAHQDGQGQLTFKGIDNESFQFDGRTVNIATVDGKQNINTTALTKADVGLKVAVFNNQGFHEGTAVSLAGTTLMAEGKGVSTKLTLGDSAVALKVGDAHIFVNNVSHDDGNSKFVIESGAAIVGGKLSGSLFLDGNGTKLIVGAGGQVNVQKGEGSSEKNLKNDIVGYRNVNGQIQMEKGRVAVSAGVLGFKANTVFNNLDKSDARDMATGTIKKEGTEKYSILGDNGKLGAAYKTIFVKENEIAKDAFQQLGQHMLTTDPKAAAKNVTLINAEGKILGMYTGATHDTVTTTTGGARVQGELIGGSTHTEQMNDRIVFLPSESKTDGNRTLEMSAVFVRGASGTEERTLQTGVIKNAKENIVDSVVNQKGSEVRGDLEFSVERNKQTGALTSFQAVFKEKNASGAVTRTRDLAGIYDHAIATKSGAQLSQAKAEQGSYINDLVSYASTGHLSNRQMEGVRGPLQYLLVGKQQSAFGQYTKQDIKVEGVSDFLHVAAMTVLALDNPGLFFDTKEMTNYFSENLASVQEGANYGKDIDTLKNVGTAGIPMLLDRIALRDTWGGNFTRQLDKTVGEFLGFNRIMNIDVHRDGGVLSLGKFLVSVGEQTLNFFAAGGGKLLSSAKAATAVKAGSTLAQIGGTGLKVAGGATQIYLRNEAANSLNTFLNVASVHGFSQETLRAASNAAWSVLTSEIGWMGPAIGEIKTFGKIAAFTGFGKEANFLRQVITVSAIGTGVAVVDYATNRSGSASLTSLAAHIGGNVVGALTGLVMFRALRSVGSKIVIANDTLRALAQELGLHTGNALIGMSVAVTSTAVGNGLQGQQISLSELQTSAGKGLYAGVFGGGALAAVSGWGATLQNMRRSSVGAYNAHRLMDASKMGVWEAVVGPTANALVGGMFTAILGHETAAKWGLSHEAQPLGATGQYLQGYFESMGLGQGISSTLAGMGDRYVTTTKSMLGMNWAFALGRAGFSPAAPLEKFVGSLAQRGAENMRGTGLQFMTGMGQRVVARTLQDVIIMPVGIKLFGFMGQASLKSAAATGFISDAVSNAKRGADGKLMITENGVTREATASEENQYTAVEALGAINTPIHANESGLVAELKQEISKSEPRATDALFPKAAAARRAEGFAKAGELLKALDAHSMATAKDADGSPAAFKFHVDGTEVEFGSDALPQLKTLAIGAIANSSEGQALLIKSDGAEKMAVSETGDLRLIQSSDKVGDKEIVVSVSDLNRALVQSTSVAGLRSLLSDAQKTDAPISAELAGMAIDKAYTGPSQANTEIRSRWAQTNGLTPSLRLEHALKNLSQSEMSKAANDIGEKTGDPLGFLTPKARGDINPALSSAARADGVRVELVPTDTNFEVRLSNFSSKQQADLIDAIAPKNAQGANSTAAIAIRNHIFSAGAEPQITVRFQNEQAVSYSFDQGGKSGRTATVDVLGQRVELAGSTNSEVLAATGKMSSPERAFIQNAMSNVSESNRAALVINADGNVVDFKTEAHPYTLSQYSAELTEARNASSATPKAGKSADHAAAETKFNQAKAAYHTELAKLVMEGTSIKEISSNKKLQSLQTDLNRAQGQLQLADIKENIATIEKSIAASPKQDTVDMRQAVTNLKQQVQKSEKLVDKGVDTKVYLGALETKAEALKEFGTFKADAARVDEWNNAIAQEKNPAAKAAISEVRDAVEAHVSGKFADEAGAKASLDVISAKFEKLLSVYGLNDRQAADNLGKAFTSPAAGVKYLNEHPDIFKRQITDLSQLSAPERLALLTVLGNHALGGSLRGEQLALLVQFSLGRIGGLAAGGGKTVVFALALADMAIRNKDHNFVQELIVFNEGEVKKYVDTTDPTNVQAPIFKAFGIEAVDGTDLLGPANLQKAFDAFTPSTDGKVKVVVTHLQARGFLERQVRHESAGLGEHMAKNTKGMGLDEVDALLLNKMSFISSDGSQKAESKDIRHVDTIVSAVLESLGIEKSFEPGFSDVKVVPFYTDFKNADISPSKKAEGKWFTFNKDQVHVSDELWNSVTEKLSGKASDREIQEVFRALLSVGDINVMDFAADTKSNSAVLRPTHKQLGKLSEGQIDSSLTFNVASVLLKRESMARANVSKAEINRQLPLDDIRLSDAGTMATLVQALERTGIHRFGATGTPKSIEGLAEHMIGMRVVDVMSSTFNDFTDGKNASFDKAGIKQLFDNRVLGRKQMQAEFVNAVGEKRDTLVANVIAQVRDYKDGQHGLLIGSGVEEPLVAAFHEFLKQQGTEGQTVLSKLQVDRSVRSIRQNVEFAREHATGTLKDLLIDRVRVIDGSEETVFDRAGNSIKVGVDTIAESAAEKSLIVFGTAVSLRGLNFQATGKQTMDAVLMGMEKFTAEDVLQAFKRVDRKKEDAVRIVVVDSAALKQRIEAAKNVDQALKVKFGRTEGVFADKKLDALLAKSDSLSLGSQLELATQLGSRESRGASALFVVNEQVEAKLYKEVLASFAQREDKRGNTKSAEFIRNVVREANRHSDEGSISRGLEMQDPKSVVENAFKSGSEKAVGFLEKVFNEAGVSDDIKLEITSRVADIRDAQTKVRSFLDMTDSRGVHSDAQFKDLAFVGTPKEAADRPALFLAKLVSKLADDILPTTQLGSEVAGARGLPTRIALASSNTVDSATTKVVSYHDQAVNVAAKTFEAMTDSKFGSTVNTLAAAKLIAAAPSTSDAGTRQAVATELVNSLHSAGMPEERLDVDKMLRVVNDLSALVPADKLSVSDIVRVSLSPNTRESIAETVVSLSPNTAQAASASTVLSAAQLQRDQTAAATFVTTGSTPLQTLFTLGQKAVLMVSTIVNSPNRMLSGAAKKDLVVAANTPVENLTPALIATVALVGSDVTALKRTRLEAIVPTLVALARVPGNANLLGRLQVRDVIKVLADGNLKTSMSNLVGIANASPVKKWLDRAGTTSGVVMGGILFAKWLGIAGVASVSPAVIGGLLGAAVVLKTIGYNAATQAKSDPLSDALTGLKTFAKEKPALAALSFAAVVPLAISFGPSLMTWGMASMLIAPISKKLGALTENITNKLTGAARTPASLAVQILDGKSEMTLGQVSDAVDELQLDPKQARNVLRSTLILAGFSEERIGEVLKAYNSSEATEGNLKKFKLDELKNNDLDMEFFSEVSPFEAELGDAQPTMVQIEEHQWSRPQFVDQAFEYFTGQPVTRSDRSAMQSVEAKMIAFADRAKGIDRPFLSARVLAAAVVNGTVHQLYAAIVKNYAEAKMSSPGVDQQSMKAFTAAAQKIAANQQQVLGEVSKILTDAGLTSEQTRAIVHDVRQSSSYSSAWQRIQAQLPANTEVASGIGQLLEQRYFNPYIVGRIAAGINNGIPLSGSMMTVLDGVAMARPVTRVSKQAWNDTAVLYTALAAMNLPDTALVTVDSENSNRVMVLSPDTNQSTSHQPMAPISYGKNDFVLITLPAAVEGQRASQVVFTKNFEQVFFNAGENRQVQVRASEDGPWIPVTADKFELAPAGRLTNLSSLPLGLDVKQFRVVETPASVDVDPVQVGTVFSVPKPIATSASHITPANSSDAEGLSLDTDSSIQSSPVRSEHETPTIAAGQSDFGSLITKAALLEAGQPTPAAVGEARAAFSRVLGNLPESAQRVNDPTKANFAVNTLDDIKPVYVRLPSGRWVGMLGQSVLPSSSRAPNDVVFYHLTPEVVVPHAAATKPMKTAVRFGARLQSVKSILSVLMGTLVVGGVMLMPTAAQVNPKPAAPIAPATKSISTNSPAVIGVIAVIGGALAVPAFAPAVATLAAIGAAVYVGYKIVSLRQTLTEPVAEPATGSIAMPRTPLSVAPAIFNAILATVRSESLFFVAQSGNQLQDVQAVRTVTLTNDDAYPSDAVIAMAHSLAGINARMGNVEPAPAAFNPAAVADMRALVSDDSAMAGPVRAVRVSDLLANYRVHPLPASLSALADRADVSVGQVLNDKRISTSEKDFVLALVAYHAQSLSTPRATMISVVTLDNRAKKGDFTLLHTHPGADAGSVMPSEADRLAAQRFSAWGQHNSFLLLGTRSSSGVSQITAFNEQGAVSVVDKNGEVPKLLSVDMIEAHPAPITVVYSNPALDTSPSLLARFLSTLLTRVGLGEDRYAPALEQKLKDKEWRNEVAEALVDVAQQMKNAPVGELIKLFETIGLKAWGGVGNKSDDHGAQSRLIDLLRDTRAQPRDIIRYLATIYRFARTAVLPRDAAYLRQLADQNLDMLRPMNAARVKAHRDRELKDINLKAAEILSYIDRLLPDPLLRAGRLAQVTDKLTADDLNAMLSNPADARWDDAAVRTILTEMMMPRVIDRVARARGRLLTSDEADNLKIQPSVEIGADARDSFVTPLDLRGQTWNMRLVSPAGLEGLLALVAVAHHEVAHVLTRDPRPSVSSILSKETVAEEVTAQTFAILATREDMPLAASYLERMTAQSVIDETAQQTDAAIFVPFSDAQKLGASKLKQIAGRRHVVIMPFNAAESQQAVALFNTGDFQVGSVERFNQADADANEPRLRAYARSLGFARIAVLASDDIRGTDTMTQLLKGLPADFLIVLNLNIADTVALQGKIAELIAKQA